MKRAILIAILWIVLFRILIFLSLSPLIIFAGLYGYSIWHCIKHPADTGSFLVASLLLFILPTVIILIYGPGDEMEPLLYVVIFGALSINTITIGILHFIAQKTHRV